MRINIDIDTSALQAKTLREQKRLAFNAAGALNKTGLAAQEAVRAHMRATFHERATTKKDRKWIEDQIKLTFASPRKGVVYCELYVAPRARLLLAGFETGEIREPFVGKNIAVPNPAVAREGGGIEGEVIPELTFGKLKLKPFTVHAKTRPDTVQYKGADRTFLLKSTASNPFGGVYERVGPGRDDIRLVYSFRRAFKLRELLKFLETAGATMRDKFDVEWVIANARNPSR